MPPDSAALVAREAMRLADVDPDLAIPVAERAVRLASGDRDFEGEVVAEQAWARALVQRGEVASAIRHLRRAIRLAQRAGFTELVAESRMKLAFVLVQRGSSRTALREIDFAVHAMPGQARALSQRAVILYHVGRFDESLVDYQAAVHVLRRGNDPLELQRAILNRGVLQAERLEFEAATRDLMEADRLARQLGNDLVVGIIAQNLGFVASQRGDVPVALEYLERAEQIIVTHGGQVASVLQDRAELLLSVGLVTEARLAAQRAVAAFEASGRQLKVPELRLLLALTALFSGDWAAAAEQSGAALRQFTRQGRDRWAALARLAGLRAELGAGERSRMSARQVDELVATLAANGRPLAVLQARLDAARLAEQRGRSGAAHLVEASRVARRRGPATVRARGWYAEALLREQSNPRGAASAARIGLRILDEHHAALGASDLRAYSAAHRADLVELGLRIALRDGRPAGVFEWAERGRASRLLHRPARPSDDPELAELLPQLRATSGELERARANGLPAAKLFSRQVDLERRIRDRSRQLPGVPGRPPDPVSPRDLSRALGDRVLVEFIQVGPDLRALTSVDGRLRLWNLGPAQAVASLLDRVPFALLQLARSPRTRAEGLLRATAAQLDAALLAPLGLDARPLVVVPTGVLHSVPWSILPSCVGRAVTVCPSATLWHEAATRAPSSDGVFVASGPGLPGAHEEAVAVAAIHRTTAAVTASVDDVLRGLSSAATVHLAAHGKLVADNPLFSALRLHDGSLIVHDVQRLDRVPHTVVLAACDIGRPVVCAGDELLGLGATFIERGSARLIASVVPIPDAETRSLMIAMHQRLALGEPPALALALAQQQVASRGPADLAAAAGFVCIGAG
ncbi:CHAT domain-containing protein [Lentzea sp. NBRC 105346]|uniref:CHAT domain-containing protein n=1 Tax=Lentzea sp. NBRC 105346 TaxID=3032205 RepID=UPI0024A5ABB6|nr:CHAT domain-containing protein [Lentzea sp. NBRC 105346]GLZ28859.1 CHAT domain-containing protein [Lentzea sp. NBRC 105346]